MSEGHYLLIVLPDGKKADKREYFPLLDEGEGKRQAFDRWVKQHPNLVNRIRNRDKAENQIRESVLWTSLCHPTSWWETRPVEYSKTRRVK